jgi:hypothetical protein
MTTRKHAFYGILAMVSLLGLGITQSARANLVTNGDFETGDFTGWTVTPAASGSLLFVEHGFGPDTTFGAFFGATDHQFDTISQSFATTPGARYNLSFFYQVTNTDLIADNHFVVLFNGVNIFDNLDANPGYGTFTFNNLLATSSLTTLEFEGYNTPAFDFLDDVSVNRVAGVPDAGSTLPLLGFALAGLGILRRKLRC